MSGNFALFASVTARTFTAWLKIFVPGFLLSLAGIIAALLLFGSGAAGTPAAGHAGGAGAVAGLFVLFTQHFWATLLLLVSIIGFAVYASLASKYALQKAMYLAWDNKLGDVLVEKLAALLNKLWPGKPAPKEMPDATMLKSELREAVKQDKDTPKTGKRILNYWLKKLSLDDVDFRNPNQDFKSILIQKLKAFVGEKLEPSATVFLVIAALHILVFIVAVYFDR